MAYSPAFQFYPGEYLADKNTIPMKTVEHGAYCLLIWVAWEQDGVPDDLNELADIARLSVEEFTPMWERRIKKCFIWDEKKKLYFHPRSLKEIKKQKAWRKKKSEDGKKGAESRWGIKTSGNGSAIGSHATPLRSDASSSSSLSESLSSKTLSGDDFIRDLKTNPDYSHIQVDVELSRAEAWARDKNRQFTRRFVTSWFGRIEPPLTISTNGNGSTPQWKIDQDACELCDENGYVLNTIPHKVCKHQ